MLFLIKFYEILESESIKVIGHFIPQCIKCCIIGCVNHSPGVIADSLITLVADNADICRVRRKRYTYVRADNQLVVSLHVINRLSSTELLCPFLLHIGHGLFFIGTPVINGIGLTGCRVHTVCTYNPLVDCIVTIVVSGTAPLLGNRKVIHQSIGINLNKSSVAALFIVKAFNTVMLEHQSFRACIPVKEFHNSLILRIINLGANRKYTSASVIGVCVCVVGLISNRRKDKGCTIFQSVSRVPETYLPAVPHQVNLTCTHLRTCGVPVLGSGVGIYETTLICIVQELQHLVVGAIFISQRNKCSVGLQDDRALNFLAVPGGQLNYVGNTEHAVAAVPVRPQRQRIASIACIICRMILHHLIQNIKQSVKICNIRAAKLFIQIPAKQRAGIDNILRIGSR